MQLTILEAARILGLTSEQVRRWAREEKIPSQKDRRGTIYVHIADVRLEKWRNRGVDILLDFPTYRELEKKTMPFPVEEYFARDPGCLVCLLPRGITYALALLVSLRRQKKDVTLIYLGEGAEEQESDLVRGRKVLIVDDIALTGYSIERAKELLMQRESELEIKEIKTFVYDDFAKRADFWVERREAREEEVELKLK